MRTPATRGEQGSNAGWALSNAVESSAAPHLVRRQAPCTIAGVLWGRARGKMVEAEPANDNAQGTDLRRKDTGEGRETRRWTCAATTESRHAAATTHLALMPLHGTQLVHRATVARHGRVVNVKMFVFGSLRVAHDGGLDALVTVPMLCKVGLRGRDGKGGEATPQSTARPTLRGQRPMQSGRAPAVPARQHPCHGLPRTFRTALPHVAHRVL